MKKSFSIGIVLGLVIAILAVSLMAANPHGCPPGQDDCKLVRHEITGKVKCLPAQAVAPPWVVIGDCDTAEPTKVKPTLAPTQVPPQVPTDTPLQPATVTAQPVATATQVGHISQKATSVPSVATAAQEVGCDFCAIGQTQAASLATIAAAQATLASQP